MILKSKILFSMISIALGLFILSCNTSKKVITPPIEEDLHNYIIEGENLSNLHVDKLGNIYVVKNNRILQKHNSEGNLEYTFDYQSGGFIHSVDVSNPLQILVFFRDSYKIALLDQSLSIIQDINLVDWNKNEITAAAVTNDRKIWLFDNTNRKLQKYNHKGVLELESLDIYNNTELDTHIEYILEYENQVFLRNSDATLIIMDNLGQYIKDKDIKTGLPLQARQKQVCCSIYDQYSCLRLDNNPIQQVILVSNLLESHLESLLYKFELFQLLPGGLIKSAIIR